MDDFSVVTLVSTVGFCLGAVFGATALHTNFCAMGAISDVVFMGDWNRFRAWMLAVAVAMLGSQVLHLSGTVDLAESVYLSTNLGWAGAIIGGLMFGFGMTLGGGCGNKTLVRLGTGNLKSMVVAVVLGIFAYMTLRGLTGLARVELEDATSLDLEALGAATQAIPDILAALGLPERVARLAVIVVLAGGLLGFSFRSAEFRASRGDIAAGLIIGLLVPAGWYVTGVVGYDDFEPTPLTSFTFVAPVGEGLQYLMTFTGTTINFGIAVVGGIIAGSFIMAKATGQFRVEAFVDSRDMIKHLIGGALMGSGGVLALGCTIGQGVTGMSTLAAGSLITLPAIIAGGVFGMKYLDEGGFGAALGALFGGD